MTRQTYDNLRGVLKTKLEALVDSGSPAKTILHEVRDYTGGTFSGYPSAVIRLSGGEGEFAGTSRNQREFIFNIDLYQENKEGGKTNEEATDAMITSIDKIIEMFDKDVNLSGECLFVRIVPLLLDTTVRSGVYLFATFEVHIVDFVNNY